MSLFNNQEPVKVSPIIRGSRWILLIAGIMYGVSKHTFLSVREVRIREEEETQREIREAIIKQEKAEQSEKELQELSDLFLGPQNEEPSEEPAL